MSNLEESYRYMIMSETKDNTNQSRPNVMIPWSDKFIFGEQKWVIIQGQGSTWFYSTVPGSRTYLNSHVFAPYTAQDISDALCMALGNLQLEYTISTCVDGWVIKTKQPVSSSLSHLRAEFEIGLQK